MSFDLSDVLTDPDFVQQAEYLAGVAGVDTHGRTAPGVASWVPFTATVTTGKGARLERDSMATRVPGEITVTTQQPLRIAGPGYDADRVRWKGGVDVVAAVRDNLHWGAGFVSVTCVPESLAGV